MESLSRSNYASYSKNSAMSSSFLKISLSIYLPPAVGYRSLEDQGSLLPAFILSAQQYPGPHGFQQTLMDVKMPLSSSVAGFCFGFGKNFVRKIQSFSDKHEKSIYFPMSSLMTDVIFFKKSHYQKHFTREPEINMVFLCDHNKAE